MTTNIPGIACQVAATAALLVLLSACGPSAPEPPSATPAHEWREFEGSWISAGSRRVLALDGDRRAAVFDLRGTLMLSGAGRPGVGFRAETVALTSTGAGLVGYAVWTDERGHQVFSDLKGAGTAKGNSITGTFTGGTGRYAGATGTYQFSWQYVQETEDGTVQGRAVGFKGRVRLDESASAAPREAAR